MTSSITSLKLRENKKNTTANAFQICKVAVSTLTHDQMVDLLKTSASVMVTVIPPLSDGSPRRGCNLHNCKYTLSNYEGDYENLQGPSESSSKVILLCSKL